MAQGRARSPTAPPGGLGDGAKGTGAFFAPHYPAALWVWEFYHAVPPLPAAAELLFGARPAAEAYSARGRVPFREEPNRVAAWLRALRSSRNRTGGPPRTTRALETELN